ncbi:MAG: HupE/UreJ family protein [Gemmatimonadaceae bacterium]
MSEFLTYVTLGYRHITDPNGADHILFLLVLAAIYRFRDWRGVLGVVTAFTIGHSLTLGLAVTGWLRLPTGVVEFLIPVTIVLTAIENLVVRELQPGGWRARYRPVFAAMFGLVHGAGFANYLQRLFVEQIAVPLFGFNVGIELGQLVVLATAFVAFALVDLTVAGLRGASWKNSTPRLRTVIVSTVVAVVAAQWAVERIPW